MLGSGLRSGSRFDLRSGSGSSDLNRLRFDLRSRSNSDRDPARDLGRDLIRDPFRIQVMIRLRSGSKSDPGRILSRSGSRSALDLGISLYFHREMHGSDLMHALI